jgi:hypothetical protein
MTPDILRNRGSSRIAGSVAGTKEGVRNANANVLAKVILDIKVILEIESVLAHDLLRRGSKLTTIAGSVAAAYGQGRRCRRCQENTGEI